MGKPNNEEVFCIDMKKEINKHRKNHKKGKCKLNKYDGYEIWKENRKRKAKYRIIKAMTD